MFISQNSQHTKEKETLEMITPEQLAKLEAEPLLVHMVDADELVTTLSAALKVVYASQMLESHNAFCVGTKSYDAIHSSVHARMKDLREALEPFNEGKEKA